MRQVGKCGYLSGKGQLKYSYLAIKLLHFPMFVFGVSAIMVYR